MQIKRKTAFATSVILTVMLSFMTLIAPVSAFANIGDAVVDESGNIVLSANGMNANNTVQQLRQVDSSSSSSGKTTTKTDSKSTSTSKSTTKTDGEDKKTSDNTVSFGSALTSLQKIVTTFLLPLAIILSAWRILYIAVVCGIMGMDPIGMMGDIAKDGINAQEVKIAIMQHLTGFLKGLCWIGGIWIVFQICVSVAAMLANTIAGAF